MKARRAWLVRDADGTYVLYTGPAKPRRTARGYWLTITSWRCRLLTTLCNTKTAEEFVLPPGLRLPPGGGPIQIEIQPFKRAPKRRAPAKGR